MNTKKSIWLIASLLLVFAMLLSACGGQATPTEAPPPEPTEAPAPAPTEEQAAPTEAPTSAIDCMGANPGDEVTVFYQWSGAEEEKINEIFAPLIDECGIKIVAESSRDDAVLDTRVKSDPPDVLFWPNTSPMKLYPDMLQNLTDLGANTDNYDVFWINLGSDGAKVLAIPVKADPKTLIWYSPVQFETFGYQVPTTFEELGALVEKMVADGNIPWSAGMESGSATGWTGSDFIQDILLAQQGPEYVMGIINGSVAYNDTGVVEAYKTYVKWVADDKYALGGADGTLNTSFLDAIYKVFSDPPEAMMVKQSGFAGGEIAKQYPDLEYGVDYDFFGFPGAKGLQGGSDYLMAFGTSPAAKALVTYLTSTEGGKVWAEVGFDLSPNKGAVGNYQDPQLAKKAEILANTSAFTPDIGDTIGAPFGEAEWKAIIEAVQGNDIETALEAAHQAQLEALGLSAAIDCMGAQPGDELTVFYQWSGAEEEMINEIFAPLIDACGIKIVAESSRDDAVLDTRVKSDPPDLLFWPNTSPMSLYGDQLMGMKDVSAHLENYPSFWIDLGTSNARVVAIPVKADPKSLVWYSPVMFDTFGYEIPTTFEDFQKLADQMVADGNIPFSMGMESGSATGWTGSDFIQDIMLAQQGPEYVMGIISGTIPYDDAGVVQAYETYKKWAADDLYTIGGADGTLNTSFLDAIYKVFSDPPEALMVKQSGFAGGEIAKQYPNLEYGVDYDFFGFPGAQGLQGGTDLLMAFSDSPATQAMVAYLTSALGGRNWAKVGLGISPNKFALGNYADEQQAKMAELLANTSGFTPDIGDTIGAPFGEAEWKAIIEVLQGGDIAQALAAAATAQAQALGQ
jgi:alpha-glucoside transport system substrate-binding protein